MNQIDLPEGVIHKAVTFKSGPWNLAGDLYRPAGFDTNKTYPAIIIGHPAGGVKEQTAGTYARLLAAQGFTTLTFDAAHQGASEGEPLYLEDPARRVEDFRAAVDFVDSCPNTARNGIGVLGICGGGGFAISAAVTDHRIRAVAGLSAVDLGQLRREGLNHSFPEGYVQKTLDEVGQQRTRESLGEAPRYNTYVPVSLESIPEGAPEMYREGFDYYQTERANHPNASNKYLFTSLDRLFAFTAFEHLDMLAPRPLLMIAGSRADTLYFSQAAIDRANEPKELYTVEGASHIDMYDVPQYVNQAVDKLTVYYKQYLNSK